MVHIPANGLTLLHQSTVGSSLPRSAEMHCKGKDCMLVNMDVKYNVKFCKQQISSFIVMSCRNGHCWPVSEQHDMESLQPEMFTQQIPDISCTSSMMHQ